MKISAKTDIGCGRNENQDDYRAGILNGITWAVVCDGMGGTSGGAVASHIATDTMEKMLTDAFSDNNQEKGVAGIQEKAIQKANEEIYLCAKQNISMAGMGTTIVSAIIKENVLYLSHIGDSRCYLYRDGKLEQLTRDHSMVQALIEKGSITEEESYRHPGKNLITRALGIGSVAETEAIAIRVKEKDIILLCSDGLSNYVTQGEMQQLMQNTPFFELDKKLINMAIEAQGQDNITALLIEVEDN